MEKIEKGDDLATTTDAVARNVARIEEFYPEAFADGEIDFEALREILGAAVADGDEKYGLGWHGKRRARRLALSPSNGTLRPVPKDSVNWDNTRNLMIEGDNLEVLKLLQKPYAGKVKLIYIDPPYNTGKDFVYPDNYTDSIQNYLEITGQVDEEGRKLSTNVESSGRFHTDWLNMMYPRLILARELLREDGVICLSIDDGEVMNLRLLLDQVFGPENLVAELPTVMNLKGNNDEFAFSGTHDYTLVYARDRSACVVNELPLQGDEADEWMEDEIGPYKRGANLKATGGNAPRERRPNLYFPLFVSQDRTRVSVVRVADSDTELLPITDGEEMSWRWSREKFAAAPDDVIIVGEAGSEPALYKKQRPTLGELPSRKPKSVFYRPEYSSGNGTAELKQLFGKKVFASPPKPLSLLTDLVLIGSGPADLILDFFAGSGSTGQAITTQNAADGGSRRFILVQLPEPLDPNHKDQKAGADFCDDLGKPRNIAELTKERLRRAADKVKAENPDFDGDLGFRVFQLDSSNIRAWDPQPNNLEEMLEDSVEHIKPSRLDEDVLCELLLKLGLDLSVPIESKEIAATEVHSVGAGALFACLASELDASTAEAVAEGIAAWRDQLEPESDTTCVFRDSAFSDDTVKTNLTAILQQRGIATVRSL